MAKATRSEEQTLAARNKQAMREKKAARQKRLKRERTDRNMFVLELGSGIFDYVPMGAQDNSYRVNLSGRAWEHVSEDALGRWVYRMVR